jgi:ferritin-like metal-binding protein YciE
MAVNSIDDLFQHELQQTHKAETSILAALAKPGLIDVAQTKLLASFNAQARSRIARLEQVCKPTEFAADAAEDCFDAFDHQAAGIADQALVQRSRSLNSRRRFIICWHATPCSRHARTSSIKQSSRRCST